MFIKSLVNLFYIGKSIREIVESKLEFDAIKEIVNIQSEERIEVTGKIDLAIEDKDGSWRIVDYKTDHMLPADHGSKEAFHARLEQQYGNQLEIYKAVLQELTGKPVKEAMLLSI